MVLYPSSDTVVSPESNKTLTTVVSCKPTHMDQYQYWDSNHFLAAKHSVYNTLTHGAWIMCTRQHAFQQEEDHISQALCKCNSSHGLSTTYRPSFITGYTQATHTVDKTQHNNISATTNSSNIFLEVPYPKGLSERFNKTFRNLGIHVHFNGSKTIQNLLVATKNKDSPTQKLDNLQVQMHPSGL